LPCSIWTPHITPRMRNESSQMVPTWYCGTFSISKDMHCKYLNINWIWTCELWTFCMSLETIHASRNLLEMKGINQAYKKIQIEFFGKGMFINIDHNGYTCKVHVFECFYKVNPCIWPMFVFIRCMFLNFCIVMFLFGYAKLAHGLGWCANVFGFCSMILQKYKIFMFLYLHPYYSMLVACVSTC